MKKLTLLLFLGFYSWSFYAQTYTVVISEILFNPNGSDDGLEWVELYNTTTSDIDISNYKIVWSATEAYFQQYSYVIPNGTIINAQDYLIIGGPNQNSNNGNPCFSIPVDFNPDIDNESPSIAYAVAIALLNADNFASGFPAAYYENSNSSHVTPIHALIYDGNFTQSPAVDENGSTTAHIPNGVPEGNTAAFDLITFSWYLNASPTPAITDGDGDSFCVTEDCDDNDALIFPGSTCDDGDFLTINDVLSIACICEGEDNCTNGGVDNDNDGFCGIYDCDDNDPAIYPGAPCDDGIECTNATLDASCNCVGTYEYSQNVDCASTITIPINDTLSTCYVFEICDGCMAPYCAGSVNSDYDTWYSFTTSSNCNGFIEIGASFSPLSTTSIELFDGTCSLLSSTACDTLGGNSPGVILRKGGLNCNTTYYFRVWDIGSIDIGEIDIFVTEPECSPDFDALMALYNSTNGSNWDDNIGWAAGAAGNSCNVCSWDRVNCENIGGEDRVIDLNVSGNNLIGSISAEVGNITYLESLSFSDNYLTGTLPSEIGNLANLEIFYCRNSPNHPGLSGGIPPELGKLANLRILTIWGHTLTGNIPGELGDLSNLTSLSLNNNLLNGCFHPNLHNLCNNIGTPNIDNCVLPTYYPNCNSFDIPWATFCSNPISSDYEALMALYDSTDGANWTFNSGWGTDCDFCTWQGVFCQNIGGENRVTSLSLSNHNLVGTIPPEIEGLTELSYLYLDNNSLPNPIPTELSNLSNLIRLDLTSSDLTGSIPPELGNLTNLEWLYLSGNSFSGEIPSELGNLSSLTRLTMNHNNLTGEIPSELGNLSNLGTFYAGFNELSGCFDINLANLCGIVGSVDGGNNSFDVTWSTFCMDPANSACILDCTHPDFDALMALYSSTNGASWGNNTGWGTNCDVCTWDGITCNSNNRVRRIHFFNNGLSGTIPPEIGNLTFLDDFRVHGNNLSGNIPVEIGNLSNLEYLFLNRNQLSGTIPTEIGNLSNLTWLSLYTNQLTGTIPTELNNLSNLSTLNLFDNELSGTISSGLGNLDMVTFNVSNNQLTGNLPPEFGNWLNIYAIAFDNNSLSGCFPSSYNIFCTANYYNFSNNSGLPGNGDFDAFCSSGTGTESPDYAALMALYNSTNGASWTNNTGWGIDCDVCTWHGVTCDGNGRVSELALGANQLSGFLPPEIGDLSELTNIEIYASSISGSIPSEIGQLSNLVTLNLNSNNLMGSIPVEMGNLSNLQTFVAVFNDLSGSIPASLGNLSQLTTLEIRNNNLTGAIPPELGNLTTLTNLRLSDNQLTGSIPSEIGDLINLNTLNLNGNNLDGCFDLNLSNLCNVNFINIDCSGTCNNFDSSWSDFCTDPINNACFDCTDFDALMALYNSTNGASWTNNTGWGIGCDVCNWYGVTCDGSGRVETINLAANNLSGTIPPEIGDLSEMTQLYLHLNQIGGSIPPEIGNLSNLILLRLHNNVLGGGLPPELCNCTNLNIIVTGNNNLEGCFPSCYTSFCNIITHNFSPNPNLSGNGDFDSFCNNGTGSCCATFYNLTGTETGAADYESSGVITSSQTIEPNAIVDYDSATEINLNSGFEVILGAVFEAFIDGCNEGDGGSNIQSEVENN